MKKNTSLLGAVSLLSFMLTACAGNTIPDPNPGALSSITSQKLTWAACDPTLVPYNSVKKALGSRLQCADIKVPLDWNSPARGTLSFSLLRVQAGDQSARQGSVFFNPGGPGGDGLLFGAIYGYLWNKADTTTPAGKLLNQLGQHYDLIGFSPRGTGNSSQSSCGSNASFSPEHYQSDDRSQKNIDAMLRNAQLVAQACQKSPFTPYINTDQTARDLELARQLMGDSKLNYVGYSYGTWLGAWYAKLFPAQTGRMLLDGNTAFDKTFQDSFNLQPAGFDRAFREVALSYTARHNDVFALGSTKEDVYNVYNSIPSDLKLALQLYSANSLIQNLYSDDGIPAISVQMVAARGVSEIIKANPATNTASDFNDLIANYRFAANDDVNTAAQIEAYPLAAAYVQIITEQVGTVALSAQNAVFNSVVCNDTPTTQDKQFWIDFGNQEAKAHPLIGGGYTENACAFWGNPTTTKPATPAALPPILMLQNEYDPATPREGAISALKSLPGAKMIFVDNEAQHTAFPYDTDCVDVPVATWFLTGALPPNQVNVCQAKPLPGEDQVYPVGQDYSGVSALSVRPDARVSAFGASQDTLDAQKLLKAIIKRNAIKPR